MSRRMPWLKRKNTAEELPFEPPIRLGNMSNGEFFHQSTPKEQRIRREILRQADEKARKLGMDRREFLASAMGMATSLSVLNLASCSSTPSGDKNQGFFDVGRSGGAGGGLPPGMAGSQAPRAAGSGGPGMIVAPGAAGSPGSFGGASGGFGGGPSSGGSGWSAGGSGTGAGGYPGGGGTGGYNVPPAATMDCAMAEELLNGKGEFIMDCQTHHIEQEGEWRTSNPGQGSFLASYFSMYNGCMDADPTVCVDAQAYLEHIFLESDTTLAVLSGFPAPLCHDGVTTNCGNALDNDAMWKSRDRMNAIAKSQRVVNHCQVNPTDNLDLQLAIMERIKKEHNCWGFKSYPEWGPEALPRGWRLDDPKSGIPMIEKARALDSKIICVHKGIVFPTWDRTTSDPADAGIAAKMFPDVSFVIYHSAIEIDAAGEGAYNPMNTQGTDRLCRTFEQNGLKGKNLFAELGSCWAQVMNAPEKAQHVIGKLLKYAGEDNIVWGSECIWLGSPQMQIEAFRMFQISKEFQDKYGYPELTPAIKAKIFGLNAAKMYKINVEECRYKIKQTKLTQLKDIMDGELGRRRWAFRQPGGPRTRREWSALVKLTGGRPG